MTSLARIERGPAEKADLLPSVAARHAYRSGMAGSTAGVANGFVQGNLAILPEKLAAPFHRFCQLNPKPCPIIGMSDVGDPRIPSLGIDLDIRTDMPRYRVWRDGDVVDEPTDIMAHWRDDLVAFVLGCSFSFEEALMADDLPIRHIEQQCPRADVSDQHRLRAVRSVCRSHGGVDAAVQAGGRDPRGADHLALSLRAWRAGASRPSRSRSASRTSPSPTMATPSPVEADEIPVFWACGVTPQAVIAAAKLPFASPMRPGLMLVTDIKNKQLAVL